MGDPLGNQLTGKSFNYQMVFGEGLGQSQLEVGNGTPFFMAESIKDGSFGGKGASDSVFGKAGKSARRCHQIFIGNPLVSAGRVVLESLCFP